MFLSNNTSLTEESYEFELMYITILSPICHSSELGNYGYQTSKNDTGACFNVKNYMRISFI